jgi:hypothetical protein
MSTFSYVTLNTVENVLQLSVCTTLHIANRICRFSDNFIIPNFPLCSQHTPVLLLLAVFASRSSPSCSFTSSVQGARGLLTCRPSIWTNTNMRYKEVVLRLHILTGINTPQMCITSFTHVTTFYQFQSQLHILALTARLHQAFHRMTHNYS